jgi:acyl-CoA thioesterase YciA
MSDRPRVEARFSRVTSHICMQKDVGLNGNLFGGVMLAWMDEACAVFAREYTLEDFVVTKRFGEILFRRPVRERDVVVMSCGNVARGEHSVTFNVVAQVGPDVVFETEATFVAVDDAGKKKKIDWEGRDAAAGDFVDP